MGQKNDGYLIDGKIWISEEEWEKFKIAAEKVKVITEKLMFNVTKSATSYKTVILNTGDDNNRI